MKPTNFTLEETQKIIDAHPTPIHVWKVTMATKCNFIVLVTGECRICNAVGVTEWHETASDWILAKEQEIKQAPHYEFTLCFQKERVKEEERRRELRLFRARQARANRKSMERQAEIERLRRIAEKKWLKEYEKKKKEEERLERIAKERERAEEREWRLMELAEGDPQIAANLRIIGSVSFKTKDGVSKLRRNLAIYRLYRYCNMSPRQISSLTSYSEQSLRDIIGETFKLLCLSDNACVFRKILGG